MNVFLLFAAGVLFFVGIMHTVLAEWQGERKLVRLITRSRLLDSSDAQDLHEYSGLGGKACGSKNSPRF